MRQELREHAYRDPVHDFIILTDPLLLALVDTPEFQRLRRIRQLGATFGTYHGAEHSRFGHSLGVLWVMQRILERLRHLGVVIDDETAVVAQCAALLHDIGHGPFSHALERLLTPDRDHEAWTCAMLRQESRVRDVLADADSALPDRVAGVIEGKFNGPPFVQSLVSSQMDVDRMDYLLRDSLYTGVTYGRFDLQRLINTLLVVDKRIVLMTKGVVAAEEYILARYYMYWQVYLHKTIRGHEVLLRQVWRRACDLWQLGDLPADEVIPSLRPFLSGDPDLAAYRRLDDYDIVYAVKAWCACRDPILADLSARFLHRDLLKPIFKVPQADVSEAPLAEAGHILRARGWDPAYYLQVDRTSDLPYDYYTADADPEGHKEPILALDETGAPREITQLSHTLAALATRRKVAVNLYVPGDCVAAVRALFAPRRPA